ncbi:hypothetical protein JTB14_016382 [Gonioctena quinquepunctata]|nr:hypothetical protein JTB14_016382 [Gonioctena quinquepunctata]
MNEILFLKKQRLSFNWKISKNMNRENEIMIEETIEDIDHDQDLEEVLDETRLQRYNFRQNRRQPRRFDDYELGADESLLTCETELEHKCRAVIGSIMYSMLCTRPDLCISISILSRYQTCASQELRQAIKRVLRYIKGTRDSMLIFSSTKLDNIIEGYADADWAGDRTDCKSTTGYIFKVFGNSISWRSQKQSTVALSSTEAEYVALTNAVSMLASSFVT